MGVRAHWGSRRGHHSQAASTRRAIQARRWDCHHMFSRDCHQARSLYPALYPTLPMYPCIQKFGCSSRLGSVSTVSTGCSTPLVVSRHGGPISTFCGPYFSNNICHPNPGCHFGATGKVPNLHTCSPCMLHLYVSHLTDSCLDTRIHAHQLIQCSLDI